MTPCRMARAVMFALAALATGPALAQTNDPTLLDLSLDELLDVEVAAASFTIVPLRDAAASVTVFERRDIERLGARYLHEVLNWVPGAYTSRVATVGTENRTVLRGNPGTAGGGLLVVDGQRMNTFQSARAWAVLRNFPIDLVERIEVIRGPGGARYGGGPSDEVVNVTTRRGENAVGARATAEGGHGLTALGHAAHGEWGIDLRAQRNEERLPRYTGLFDRFGRVSESTETGATRTAIVDLSLGRHGVQVLHHESAMDGFYGLNGSINPGDESDLQATSWRYAGGIAGEDWRADWFAGTYRQRFVLSGVVFPRGVPPFVSADFRQRGLFTHRASSGGATLQRRFGDHTLTIGGETMKGRNSQADLQANYTLRPPIQFLGGFQSTGLRFSSIDASERMTAVFIEDDWRLSPTQRLVAGLRYDRYDQSGSASSPRLGWIFHPDDRYSLKVLYQEAFFAPSLGQLFLQNNRVIEGNPALRPARVNTFEVIGQRRWDDTVWSATYFHREAEDAFIAVPGSATSAITVNAAEQRSDGVETTLDWLPGQGWRLRLTASALLSDRYRLPDRIAEAPPGGFISRRTASALVHRQHGPWEWVAGAHWRSREGLQEQENDPRAMLQANWRPSPGLRVWLHVDNLFDAEGSDVDVAGGLGVDPATGLIERQLPLPGREVLLGAEWRWR